MRSQTAHSHANAHTDTDTDTDAHTNGPVGRRADLGNANHR